MTRLSPGHGRFLSERFQRAEGGLAAPGLRGSYAVVRQGQAVLGLVAVDDDLGIWYSPRAEDQADLRRHGFSYSRGNLLATLYFDLPFAAAPQPAAGVPVPTAAAPASPPAPPALPRMQRRQEPIPAGRSAARARATRRPDRMRALVQDLRYGIRVMVKAPAFSAGVIATAALAIGANAAIFSVAHAVLLRQLPYRHPERLAWVWSRQTAREKGPFNIPDFVDVRDGNHVLERLSAMTPWNATLAGTGEPERVQGLRVSADLFDTLGVDAAVGRTLRPEDDRPGAARVVVLTHGMWARRFGADPRILGAKLVLDDEPFTVVGILRPAFFLPLRDAELAAPLVLDADPRRRVRSSVAFLRAVGRLRPGTSLARARDTLTAIAARLQREYPDTNARKIGVTLVPIGDEIVGGYRAALLALMAAVGGLLVIACANLANLTLARGSARATAIATRLALGATRGRLARQLLTESMVLAVAGGIGGAAAAAAGVRALLALAPADLPRLHEIAVDRTVLLFTLATTIAAGIAFGLIPAFVVSRTDLGQALKDGARGASDGPRGRRARHGLVATEVAIAVVLSIVVGLFARSYANLQAVRIGFDPSGAVAARIALPSSRYAAPRSIAAYQRRVLASVLALGAVESAGAVSLLPLAGWDARVDFTVAGRARPSATASRPRTTGS
ncbi:MAG TPA: ABC transporter permease [Thermoanaerobaculia bacterium]|jgi:putative ABC transport system permease protein|nr:ABC transporter permease [Thermoanaerobaculia bacterium]